MTSRERVIKAITFDRPDRIPVWLLNQDQTQGDVLWYDLRVNEGDARAGYHGSNKSEWGYVWTTQDDGTMGQPTEPVIKTWDELGSYEFPKLNADKRLRSIKEYMADSEGYYRLPMLIVTGFTTYTFLRGFENAMVDFIEEPENSAYLLDKIFEFEKSLVTLAAENGFDGFHFGDDWGTQDSLIISPQMWRRIFKPRYKALFDHAHKLGLHVWFHSCGSFAPIIADLFDAGVDVMNIAQPNVVDLEKVSGMFKGQRCFLLPISYQTVSISGSPAEIEAEGKRIRELFASADGGLIGYVEEYGCMGMSAENFQACKRAFLL